MTEQDGFRTHSGVLTANLAETYEQYDLPFLVSRINDNIKPPTPISEGDIFIRAMYIVSDAVNAYGGRFPADEHPRLADLMIDAPVLIGHRKDRLPVGRNFHAVVEVKEGKSWVKSYFYWLKSAEGAQSLRDNIDGGIYKECSIGFMYGLAECSVCGSDMRACGHQTASDGSVWFNYRQIQRVLETSLVYRGATPDTSISKQLDDGRWDGRNSQTQPREWNPRPIADWRELDRDSEYVVVPAYSGIPVEICARESLFEVRGLDDKVLLSLPINSKTSNNNPFAQPVEGLLVGMRGRDRCTAAETELYLKKGRGPVSRLELRLFPYDEKGIDSVPARCGELAVRKMRTGKAVADHLRSASLTLQTREGVYLWRMGASPFHSPVYLAAPSKLEHHHSSDTKSITQSDSTVLELSEGSLLRRFVAPKSFASLLASGKKLVVDEMQAQGSVVLPNAGRTGFTCFLAESQTGIHVRPVRLNGGMKYVIYKSPAGSRAASFAGAGIGG